MKNWLLITGTLGAAGFIAGHADVRNYPWCAYYKGDGGANCGFPTYEQCLATVRGIGGYCARNTQYLNFYPPFQ